MSKFIESLVSDVKRVMLIYRDVLLLTYEGLKEGEHNRLLKYALLSLVLLFLAFMLPPYSLVLLYTVFLPMYMYVMDYYRVDLKKSRTRITLGMLGYFVLDFILLKVMELGSAFSESIGVVFSFIGMFLMIYLPFIPLYIAKAGSGFRRALSQSLRFLMRMPFTTLFFMYVGILSILFLSFLFGPLSLLVMVLGMFVLQYAVINYWGLVRKSTGK